MSNGQRDLAKDRAQEIVDGFYEWLKDENISQFVGSIHGSVEYYIWYDATNDRYFSMTTASRNWAFPPEDNRRLIKVYHSSQNARIYDYWDRWQYEPYIGLTNMRIALANGYISRDDLGEKWEEYMVLCAHFIDGREIDNAEERYEGFLNDRRIYRVLAYASVFADFAELRKDEFLRKIGLSVSDVKWHLEMEPEADNE